MVHISKNNLPTELYTMPVITYGGGYTGRIVIDLLVSEGILINYIIDDNEKVQGTKIKDIKVISFEQFSIYSQKHERIAVILTTIYGKAVLRKLSMLSNITEYELYDWYMEIDGHKDKIQKYLSETDKVKFMKMQVRALENELHDEESKRVLEGILQYLETRSLDDLANICTEDTQYMIPEVKKIINFPLNIIDAGAYKGEFLQIIKDNGLSFEKWYCFEADIENFEYLLKSYKDDKENGRQICVNKGLWNTSGRLFFESGMGTASRIVSYETENKIDTVSIDDYLGEESCNYIKMDIEGAELMALQGGIKLILRERPILAISIYHSLDDFWEIPKYLMQKLDNYRYYIRHHSLIFSETVLYGIPCEL